MNARITYKTRVVIKDKPLYRTIAEWTIAGALVGAGIMFAYKSQSDFKENVVNHSQQTKKDNYDVPNVNYLWTRNTKVEDHTTRKNNRGCGYYVSADTYISKKQFDDFVEKINLILEQEIINLKACERVAKKSNERAQVDSNKFHRELGEKIAFRTGVITLKRVKNNFLERIDKLSSEVGK